METLRQHELYAKIFKCDFQLDSVAFLGHVINKDGVFVDPKKVEAVMDWNRPALSEKSRVSLAQPATIKDLYKTSPGQQHL